MRLFEHPKPAHIYVNNKPMKIFEDVYSFGDVLDMYSTNYPYSSLFSGVSFLKLYVKRYLSKCANYSG